MGTKGNPAARAEELKISQIGDFKKRMGGVMKLPSGLVVKVKNPGGMKAFLTGGLIPNSLMGVIKSALEGDEPKKFDGTEFLNEEGGIDTDTLDEMMQLLDSIAVKCIVEPPIHPAPEDEADRDDNLLYADELPEDDKMFVFQWLTGGTSDLSTFREGHQQNMGAVAAESSARAATQRGTGTDAR